LKNVNPNGENVVARNMVVKMDNLR
jgi:hypothetical protein